MTEQGEVIANKYGEPEIALRNLDALTCGAMLASLGKGTDHAFTAEHGATLSDLSARSMAAYRKLVYETDGFVDYYRAATPIAEIADLIGVDRDLVRLRLGFDFRAEGLVRRQHRRTRSHRTS